MRYPKSNARWWELGGIVAAYQSISAPSQLASYQNVGQGRLGTYTAAPGVAPTWSPPTGWGFNGTTQYLQVPPINIPINISVCIRVYSSNFNQYGMLIDKQPVNAQWQFFLDKDAGGLGSYRLSFGPSGILESRVDTWLNASYDNSWHVFAATMEGLSAKLYVDGILQSSKVLSAYIGNGMTPGINDVLISTYDGVNYPLNGKVANACVSDRPLTAAEVWLASKQMAYCEQNPDWNAWVSRRRYFIFPAVTAGRVGIYGRQHSLKLPGGVSIKGIY